MKYDVRMSTRFKKDMKLVQKRGYDQRLIFEVIELLANGMKLDEKYKDHLLTGDYGGFRECHITPDWLLVYQYREQELLLLRKLKEKAILRFKRQIEESDYQIAMMAEAKR